MDEALLRTAQDALRITDVALRSSRATLAEGFEPKYEMPKADLQFMQRTARFEVMEISRGEGDHEMFRVFVDFGIRWVRAPKGGKRKSGKAGGDANDATRKELARIEATFIAEYQMAGSIDKPALDEFALHNAPWHMWPYWREYVASQCMRMNLPKVAMPMRCRGDRVSETKEKE